MEAHIERAREVSGQVVVIHKELVPCDRHCQYILGGPLRGAGGITK